MRRVLFVATCSIIASCASAREFTVSFDETIYHLAYAKESINEYVPPGSTLENWTKLIGLHRYANHGVTPCDFAVRMGNWNKEHSLGSNFEVLCDDRTEEAILLFLAWVPAVPGTWFTSGKPMIAEFNIFKLKYAPDRLSLIAYQYAFRGYGELSTEFVVSCRENRERLTNLMIEQPYPEFVSEEAFNQASFENRPSSWWWLSW